MPTKVHAHIYNWLAAGADAKVGLRLFIEYCQPNKTIQNLVSTHPEKHIHIIKAALCHKAGITDYRLPSTVHRSPLTVHRSPLTDTPSTVPRHCEPAKQSQTETAVNHQPLRSDWPFLAEPDCPPELKILVGDKITAYHNYAQAYTTLHKATTLSEQTKVVSYLVENYIENHLIYKELLHYKKHNKVLGKHPIFAHLKKLNKLRTLPTLELIKKKDRLEHNIWRNKNKLKTDPRPDLRISREKRIRKMEIELAEIIRLLDT